MATMVESAIEDANRIADYLKTNYPGMPVQKAEIRIAFNLPHNRGSLVFQQLAKLGFNIEATYVVVPGREKNATEPS